MRTKVYFYKNPLMQPRDGRTLKVEMTLTEVQFDALPTEVHNYLAISAEMRPVSKLGKVGF